MRIVFDNPLEFGGWMEKFAMPEKYAMYETKEKELVLAPIKSTRPLYFAYRKCESDIELGMLKAIATKRKLSIFAVQDVEWADDRPVGMKFNVNE